MRNWDKYQQICDEYGVETTREAVVEYVKRGIESGRFSHGSKLPNGAQISEELDGVSTATVSNGMYDLIEQGIVQKKPYTSAPSYVAYPPGREADLAELHKLNQGELKDLSDLLQKANALARSISARIEQIESI